MPIVAEQNLRLAVRNVAGYGDTDVFPFPLENHWFHDEEDAVVDLLQDLDGNFDSWMARYPVLFVKSLGGVGYSGFRAATQIDPIWNAYLLGLVLQIAPEIEQARVSVDRSSIFSYRYSPDTTKSSMFNSDLGWGAFHRTALKKAESFDSVLSTDISDFYPRIYHHRLENALQLATSNKEAAKRIMVILFKLAGGTSYGLPVGGNAARLLAELLLNRVDRLLAAERVEFIRFVDDYYLFANSREEAQRCLVTLSDALLRNEGLTLSRGKTRLMTRSEFERASPLAEPDLSDSEEESEAKRFLKFRITYDPYSPTADADYEELAEELNKFDVLSMLAREFRKTRIDEVLIRKLIKSIRFLSQPVRDRALISVIDNLNTLYPVFPTVAILLKGLLNDMSQDVRDAAFRKIRALILDGSHITLVPANRLYAIRLLAHDPSEDADPILVDLHNQPKSDMMAKRDIIFAMVKRGVAYWLSDLLKRYPQLTPWEKRAVLVASYRLGDEGRYWRDSTRGELSGVDQQFLRWVGKKSNGRTWDLPL